MSYIDVHRRKDRKWAWRLVAANGQVIATDGSQGYEKKADAFEMGRAIVTGDYSDAKVRIEGTDFADLSELDGITGVDADNSAPA